MMVKRMEIRVGGGRRMEMEDGRGGWRWMEEMDEEDGDE